MHKINVGDALPSFKALDQEGFEFETEDLFGNSVLLYFYPKDDTPGCTKEACAFRDHLETLEDYGVLVIGISPDGADSHNKFIEKYGLNFTLLCDEKMELCKKFDVLKDNKVVRTTFLADEDGIIQWIERPVNVEGHVERVIEAAKKLEITSDSLWDSAHD